MGWGLEMEACTASGVDFMGIEAFEVFFFLFFFLISSS